MEKRYTKEEILNALNAIDPDCHFEKWLHVGMALHQEGFPIEVWDEWSKRGSKYKGIKDLEAHWKSFDNNKSGNVSAGTIIKYAKEAGWGVQYTGANGIIGWNDAIEQDDPPRTSDDPYRDYIEAVEPGPWDPVGELKKYINILFEPNDYVGFVSTGIEMLEDGRLRPNKGRYNMTAGQIIEKLDKHPEDIGAAIGDYNPEIGAYIRFNPLDGQGVSDKNVADYRYALVECDSVPIAEQEALYRKYELPIAVMVYSGGKSVHAIVKIEADSYEEYRKRVNILYDFLASKEVDIDTANRNPSRLSRMPGVMRNGNRQYIIDTNIGRSSWTDWMDYVEGVNDTLPGIVSLEYCVDHPDEYQLTPELIPGILRMGHKMLVSGPSKAGKSFFLMQIANSLAHGTDFLDMKFTQCKVLYINLEIDPASCVDRFNKILDKVIPEDQRCLKNLDIWNLRGCALPMDKLTPKIIRRAEGQNFGAIIIDPIYKILTGDENSASDMAEFTSFFDKVAKETGAAIIFCHHHSKGTQGGKRAMDRASGSGVFSRDPDAQLDMTPLTITAAVRNFAEENEAFPFRLEFSLREFKNPKPKDIWFGYPVHYLDPTGELQDIGVEGSSKGNLEKSSKRTTPEQRFDDLTRALSVCAGEDGGASTKDIAKYLDVCEETVRRRVNEFNDDFLCAKGIIYNKNKVLAKNTTKEFSPLL